MLSQTSREQWVSWRLPLLVLIVLLIVVAPTLLRQQLQDDTLDAVDLVTHTREVQADISRLNVEIREIEQSALLVNLGATLPRLRERVQDGPNEIQRQLDQITQLTRDNAPQQVRLGQLKEVLQRRAMLANELLDAPSERRAEVVQSLANDYPVRPLMMDIYQSEQGLAQGRIAQAERSRRLGNWVGWGGLAVQLLLLAVITMLLGRQSDSG